jgi:hypothetical protein
MTHGSVSAFSLNRGDFPLFTVLFYFLFRQLLTFLPYNAIIFYERRCSMHIWLDDIRDAPDGFIHVKNLAELRQLIASRSDVIEVMSFDHDLGDGEKDGYEIAKWFAKEHLNRWPLETKVHSANPPGADNIRQFDQFVRNRLLA